MFLFIPDFIYQFKGVLKMNESRGVAPSMRTLGSHPVVKKGDRASGKRNQGKGAGHLLLGGFDSLRLTLFCCCGLDMVAALIKWYECFCKYCVNGRNEIHKFN